MTRKGTILSKITVEQEPGLTDTLVTAELDTTHTAPTFAELGVREEIVRALDERGIERTFAIQELTLPLALAGEDLIGQARTGMGKTFGFGVPLLHRVATADSGTTPLDGTPRALVIVPTRELCIQVTEDLERAAKYLRNHKGALKVSAIYGGRPYDSQIAALRDGVDVVVGTPGRLMDLAKQNHLILGKIGVLVLDEADEMLDLGFLPDIERILTMVPAQRQTMLFSATMPGPIITLARTFLTRPTHIRAEEPHDSAVHDRTAQFVYRAHALDKAELVARVLQADSRGATMIFTRTKRTAQKVADDLAERGFAVGAVHGDLNQVQREKALDKFRKGAIDVLVATDVAARGIDIDDVTHVINYQCPEDEKTYVHRIGRTGRAGRTGVAITLIDWDELNRWASIDTALGLGIPEPVETYSRSPHLFADLGIPEGITGTVRKAPRVREAEAVVEERPARAPRKRNRKRTLRGKPLDESQTTENSRTSAADTAERVSADTPAADTPAADTSVAEARTEGDRTDTGEAPARRRRRRRRGGSGTNTHGTQGDSAVANDSTSADAGARAATVSQTDAVTSSEAVPRSETSASDGAAPRADAPASDADVANLAVAQAESFDGGVDSAAVATVSDAATTVDDSVRATDAADASEVEAPRRRTRRRTGATKAADTATTDTATTDTATTDTATVTAAADSAATVDTAATAPAAAATSAEAESADAEVAQALAEPVERAPRKRTARAAEASAADGPTTPRRRTRKVATTEPAEAATAETAEAATARTTEAATAKATEGDKPAPRKRTTTRKKATADADTSAPPAAAEAATATEPNATASIDAGAQPAEATQAPDGTDAAEASGTAPRRRTRKAATAETTAAVTAKATEGEKPAPRKRTTTRKKATADADTSAPPAAAEAAATATATEPNATASADAGAQPAEATQAPDGTDAAEASGTAPRRRTRKAATAETTAAATAEATEGNKPAPRKRTTRKKTESNTETVETKAGSAASV